MRYLVTGGLGVIGSCIARKLLDAGHEVSIIDSAEEPRNAWVLSGLSPHRSHIGRIERMGSVALDSMIEPMDAVIHCAASTGIPYSVTEPDDDWERNVDGTRALLEALRCRRRPTVVLSSVKPYRTNPLPLTEENVLEPDEPYAASKAAQSMLCQAYAKSYGIPIVTFRCSNLYGPAPCHGPRHGWLTWFCISAAIGRTVEIQGSGKQTRDMLHADDVYSACMLALANADKLKGEIFNLGGGRDNRISVEFAARYLNEATGVKIVSAPKRAMDDDCVFADFTKFKRATDWTPKVTVHDGLRITLNWALANSPELARLYEGI